MNFDVTKAYFIPFSLAEKDMRNGFYDFLIEDANSPVDIAFAASITKISRVYYPVRCFDVRYSAEWSATSIWEHKEEYTEYEPRTIYIDYNGKEHNKPGFDSFNNGSYTGTSSSGGTGKRPWRPQQRMVPVTKYKTVVDNVEETYGNIGDNRSFQPVITFASEEERPFSEWVVNTDIEGNYLPIHVDLIKGCEIKELIETEDFAKNIAMSNVASLAKGQCQRSVPGTRYTDFSVYNIRTNYKVDIVLIPLFHIEYEYKNQKFECWSCGVTENRFSYVVRPVDEGIKEENTKQENEVNELTMKWWKSVGIMFIAIPFGLLIAFMIFIVSPLSGLILFGAGIYFETGFVKKHKILNKKLNDAKEKNENYVAVLAEKRTAIAEIMKDDGISEEEKAKKAAEILGE